MMTVLIPFYYKLDLFKQAFPYNERFLTSEHELLIVVDEPDSGLEIDEYLKSREKDYSLRVISNPNRHEWRNPGKAINVGIIHALGEYIIVMSPESICITNIYDKLVRACKAKDTFAYGRVTFLEYDEFNEGKMEQMFDKVDRFKSPHGSICFKKSNAHLIRGYNEHMSGWGYDDDEFRVRYEREFEKEGVCVLDAKVLHLNHWVDRLNRTDKEHYVVNGDDWGKDF